MSLRMKLIIIFLAIALIPLLFVSLMTFRNYKQSLETTCLASLEDIAAFKTDKIETYFKGLKDNIETTQSFYNIKTNLPVLTRLFDDPNHPEFMSAQNMLDSQLQQIQMILELDDIMLVNPEGKIVYTSNHGHYSKDYAKPLSELDPNAFEAGKKSIFISDIFLNKTDLNKPTMLVSAPAVDFDGIFIGIIVFEVDTTSVYKILLDIQGLGKTAEVLVGRKHGNHVEFISPLKSDPLAALSRKVAIGQKIANPIQEAVQGRTGAGISIDYRGKEVIAAWRYMPTLKWGMVTKIDVHEALAEVTELRNLEIIILVIITVIGVILAFWLSESITRPLKKLGEGAEIIGRGNLDYKISTGQNDEIGLLSRSFDKMTHALKQTLASRDELNKEVLERKRAEEQMRQQQMEIEDLYHNAPVGLCLLDRNLRFIRINERLARINGIPAADHIGKSIRELMPALADEVEKPMRKLIATGLAQYDIEVVGETPVRPGIKRIWLQQWLPVRNDQGHVSGLSIVVEEITERKRIQNTFRFLAQCDHRTEGEDFFQSLARYLGQTLDMDFVCIDRLEENVLTARSLAVYYNGKFEDNTSYTLKDTPCGDTVGKTICSFNKEVRQLFPNDKVLQDIAAESYIGTTLWSSHGQPIGLIAMIGKKPLDDTKLAESILQLAAVRAAGELERRQFEEAVLVSEVRYRRLFEAARDGILILNAESGQIVDVNPFIEKMLGYSHLEFLNKKLWEIGLFKNILASKEAFLDLQNKGYIRHENLPLETKDGRRIAVEFVSNVYRVDHHKVIQCNIRDITDRVQAEESVRKSRDELETRVKERTHELAETVIVLEDEVRVRIGAEKTVRQGEERYRSLTLATTQLIWTTDAGGQVTADVPAWRTFTGQSVEEIQGWGWIHALHPDDGERTRKIWTQSVQEKTLYQTEYRVRRHDGVYRYMSVRGVPVVEPDGRIREWVGTCTDITERKLAEEKQVVTKSLLELFARKTSRKEYLDAVVEEIRNWSGCQFVGIRIQDNEQNIPYESSIGFDDDFLAEEKLLHLGRDNCICMRVILEAPRPSEINYTTDSGSFYCNDSMLFLNGLAEQEKKTYRGTCMKHGFQSIAVIPIRYRDKVMGAIHITDLKKNMVSLLKIQFIETTIAPLVGEAVQRFNAESELEQYGLLLEDLVRQRTRELENANRQLQSEAIHRQQIAENLARSNKDLEQFAYVASHDLQEPLRAVSGFVELLQRNLQGSLDDKTAEYMNFTIDGARRMQSLVNDLLEYSRVSARGQNPEQTDSKAALDLAIAHLLTSIKESQADVNADDLPRVHVDAVQLTQLFQNLIGNAIKFHGPQPPQVHISASHQDHAWQFAVSDNGIGIEPQYAERIFLIFHRLHTRKQYPGTGIGLAICKKIIERHGGKIWVESKPECGSTFYFTIPDREETNNESGQLMNKMNKE